MIRRFFLVVSFFIVVSASAAGGSIVAAIDDPLLARTAAEVFSNIEFITGKSEGIEVVLVNGLAGDIAAGAYDYTAGIVDTVPGEGGGMNPNVIYAPDKLAAVMNNIAQVMGLFHPEMSGAYEKAAKKYASGLERFKDLKLKKRRLAAVYGYRYDHLLEYLGLEKINVDGYFIYKEKAYGSGLDKNILCDPDKDTGALPGLTARGYFFFKVDYRKFDTVTQVIEYIIKEYVNG